MTVAQIKLSFIEKSNLQSFILQLTQSHCKEKRKLAIVE